MKQLRWPPCPLRFVDPMRNASAQELGASESGRLLDPYIIVLIVPQIVGNPHCCQRVQQVCHRNSVQKALNAK